MNEGWQAYDLRAVQSSASARDRFRVTAMDTRLGRVNRLTPVADAVGSSSGTR